MLYFHSQYIFRETEVILRWNVQFWYGDLGLRPARGIRDTKVENFRMCLRLPVRDDYERVKRLHGVGAEDLQKPADNKTIHEEVNKLNFWGDAMVIMVRENQTIFRCGQTSTRS